MVEMESVCSNGRRWREVSRDEGRQALKDQSPISVAVIQLVAELDKYIPLPARAIDGTFTCQWKMCFDLRPRHIGDRGVSILNIVVNDEEGNRVAKTQNQSARAVRWVEAPG
jgi:translation elongation factor EF-Tu-like GTPase